jgi:uncharacterized protein (DUF305 family)
MTFVKSRRIAALAAVGALALVLAGCGSDSDDAASDHNSQDITFAKDMIPHHSQAVEMAKLASTRASSPEVKQLASAIQGAQQPEIDTMNGWLKSWGEPEIDAAAAASMDHSAHGSTMKGMMSADEMSKLESASGAEFDKLFLEGMTKHHEGAITMAKTEQQKGKYEAAKTMAGEIITSQQAELDQMKRLLG